MAPRSPRPARSRPIATVAAAALSVAILALAGCSSDGDDVDRDGAGDQAVDQLVAFGLTTDQAECVVDQLGAETVVEAADLTALAESQTYRDVAEACADDD